MPNPSFPSDYYLTVEQFEQLYRSEQFRAASPEQDHFECDLCGKGVPYAKEPRVAQYLTDRLPVAATPKAKAVNEEGVLTPLATYCEDCSQQRLFFPCEGYTEVRVFLTLNPALEQSAVSVTDVSSAQEGIPWAPGEVVEAITGVSFERFALVAGEDVAMGPENVVAFFLSLNSNIDIRELIDYTGDLDPAVLSQVQAEWQSLMRKLQASDFDREAFRDHVRGQSTDR